MLGMLVSFIASAQQSYQHNQQLENKQYSEAELAQMLAPIALYPDSLLTHILISSTYPIEIIEAHRWLKKNEQLNSVQIAKSIENFSWDASVKALVPFEQILRRLSEDLGWMQQLGDAFLQDEAKVLESIQLLREQAKLAGNLDKMDNMDVSYENNNIIIEPVKKEIVYVPYYDTRMVFGNWYWSSYPPVYWAPYHRVYVNHYNPFHWHSGIHISFNYFFSAFHWHNRHVIVVNSHRSHYRYYHQRPRRLIARGGYAKRWSHQPCHRRGVAYRTKQTRQKYKASHLKMHNSRKSSHHAIHNFKQRLSANKKSIVGTPKQYSAKVKQKELRQKKNDSHSARTKNLYSKSHSPNKPSANKVTPKVQRQDANKSQSKVVKRNKHSNRQQHHKIASSKNHKHSNKTRVRY